MNVRAPLRSGIFLAPFHPLNEDPTLAIRRDIELVEWLDELGYEEAWIGEHHSAGFEIIASPELFIAAAAERTQRIKLGTGVVSLPYHNPLTAANRIIQLDHQTRGRVLFGVGPGLLPSDAMMMGIPVDKQRDRMVESIEVILRLFKGETVTHETEWFKLTNARMQLLPYTKPYPEIAVASSVTPSGGRLAGTPRIRHVVRRRDESARLRRARHQLGRRAENRRRERPHDGPGASCASSARCTSRRRAKKRANRCSSVSTSGAATSIRSTGWAPKTCKARIRSTR